MTKTEPSKAEVKKAVGWIRRWHTIGRKSLEKRPGDSNPGQDWMTSEAVRLRISPAALRKLRQFAQPATGYNAAMLDRLCADCEKAGRPLGISFIMRLVSIPDRKLRREIQTRLLKENWPLKRLNLEMRMRLGRQRSGGRRVRIPADLPGALTQLDGMIEPWTRWHRRMKAAKAGGEILPVLSPKVRAGVDKVIAAMVSLRSIIQAEDEMTPKSAAVSNTPPNLTRRERVR